MFETIAAEYNAFAEKIGLRTRSRRFRSPALRRQCQRAQRADAVVFGPDPARPPRNRRGAFGRADKPFRMPVQWVNRPNQNFRGFSGTIASGVVRPGDKIVSLPSGRTSKVKSIVTFDGELKEAVGRRRRHGDLGRRDRRQPRRCACRRYRAPCPCRTVRRPHRLDGRRADAAGPQLFLRQCRQPDRRRRSPSSSTRSTSTRSSTPPPRISSSTKSAIARSRSTRRWRSIPTAKTARWARFILIDRFSNATVGCGHDRLRAPPRHQYPLAGRPRSTRPPAPPSRHRSRACCGSPACRARANRPSPIWSSSRWRARAATPSCSTATMSATA